MSIVLGIATSHDVSTDVLRDSKPVAAVSEERISRIKCDGGRDHLAIGNLRGDGNLNQKANRARPQRLKRKKTS